jgi:two-component system, OmpR family, phosphate regulon sensor histidine kinase PhoR
MKKQLQHILSGNPVFVTVFAVLCILVFQFWWLRSDYLEKKQQLTDEAANKLNAVVLNENLRETNRYLEGMKSNKLINDLTGVLSDNLGGGVQPEIYIYTDSSEAGSSESDAEILKQLGLTAETQTKVDPGVLKKRMGHAVDSALAPLKISYRFYLPTTYLIAPDDTYILSETPLLQGSQRCAVQLKDLFRPIAARMIPSVLLSLLYLCVCLGTIILLNRNLRQTRNLMLLKRNFTNNMTHELKTPLATISAATESLDRYNGQQDPEMAKEYLGFIRGEVDRLSRLIDTILVHSQLETDNILLDRRSIPFGRLVANSVARMQPRLDEYEAVLDHSGIPDKVMVNGDLHHLTNVFTNLIDNALKYSDGRPELRLSAQVNGNLLKISVADNGIGIPEKHLAHIFDPYYRVPEKDNDLHSVKGYGLGLNYVRQIVQLHGGTIRAASTVGKGTTFTLTLPLSYE